MKRNTRDSRSWTVLMQTSKSTWHLDGITAVLVMIKVMMQNASRNHGQSTARLMIICQRHLAYCCLRCWGVVWLTRVPPRCVRCLSFMETSQDPTDSRGSRVRDNSDARGRLLASPCLLSCRPQPSDVTSCCSNPTGHVRWHGCGSPCR